MSCVFAHSLRLVGLFGSLQDLFVGVTSREARDGEQLSICSFALCVDGAGV